jgi:hypothetical protein
VGAAVVVAAVVVAAVVAAAASSVIIHSIEFQQSFGVEIEMLGNPKKDFSTAFLHGVQSRIGIEGRFGGPAKPS